ncbi:MAG: hypothetical protein DWI09_04610 [Planctomycetota bacterium]|nr:MAG: hypothetical protein DWI09_04610 [Planctomycetota bacterium]
MRIEPQRTINEIGAVPCSMRSRSVTRTMALMGLMGLVGSSPPAPIETVRGVNSNRCEATN